MAQLHFKNINKIYDNNVQAVFDFNLDVKDKEFIVLIGPSGCGKSTTLRMVAGLEEITNGELFIDDKKVNFIAPRDRDIAMVFQSYALYPHMSVFKNMAFGLNLRRIPKDKIIKRVCDVAEILGLTEYLERKPKQLSGGQRQRVALGRAIVREPKVFLMDEPLSNLDAKLRIQMRSEIIRIHKRVGATTLYVTHDQTEAMTMADRIVVMSKGYVQQIGTPKEVYKYPKNIFVATFIGAPSMNIIKAHYNGNEITIKDSFKMQVSKKFIEAHNNFYNERSINIEKEIENKKYKLEHLKSFKAKEELDNAKKEYINELNSLKASNSSKEEIEEKTKIIKEKYSPIIKTLEIAYNADKRLSKKDRILKEEEINNELNELNQVLNRCKEAIKTKNHDILLGIRPEDIYLENDLNNTDPSPSFTVVSDICELLGKELNIYGFVDDQKIAFKVTAKNEEFESGKEFKCSFIKANAHVFDIDSTLRIEGID